LAHGILNELGKRTNVSVETNALDDVMDQANEENQQQKKAERDKAAQ
jgi:hypothetical protein